MPSCYICGKGMDEIHLDHRDMKTRPCSECESIINDIILGFGDGDITNESEIELAYVETTADDFYEEFRDSQPCLGDTEG